MNFLKLIFHGTTYFIISDPAISLSDWLDSDSETGMTEEEKAGMTGELGYESGSTPNKLYLAIK